MSQFFLFLCFNVASAQYFGKPIEVTAQFTIEEDSDVKTSTNRNIDQMPEESFFSLKKTRPRPYLDERGQIQFYKPELNSISNEKPTIYKTTIRPVNGLATQTTRTPIKTTIKPVHSFAPTSTTLMYRPTFKPAVMVAEIANVEISTTPTPSTTTALTTEIADEKIDWTSTLNALSSNSLVNMAVVFGLPAITALLSFMGAGPFAIASVAWLIPIAALVILPDLKSLSN